MQAATVKEVTSTPKTQTPERVRKTEARNDSRVIAEYQSDGHFCLLKDGL